MSPHELNHEKRREVKERKQDGTTEDNGLRRRATYNGRRKRSKKGELDRTRGRKEGASR